MPTIVIVPGPLAPTPSPRSCMVLWLFEMRSSRAKLEVCELYGSRLGYSLLRHRHLYAEQELRMGA